MKSTKKLLSVVLAVLMVMTSVTCAFTAFGAASGVTDAQWDALIEALENDTVQSATFNNGVVVDPDGSIIALADAYWAVLGGSYDKASVTNNSNNSTVRNSTIRTLSQVRGVILNTLSAKMGEKFEAYNVGSIITGLTANAQIDSEVASNTSSANTGVKSAGDVTLTVKPSENFILDAETIAEIPDEMVTGKTYTVKHANKQERNQTTTGSGCNSSTTNTYYNFLMISALETNVTDTIKRADYEKYEELFAEYEEYFGLDMAALFAMEGETIQDAANKLSAAVNAIPAALLTQFFGEVAADVDALVPEVEAAVDAQNVVSTIIATIDEAVAAVAETEARTDLVDLINTIDAQMKLYNAKSAKVKDFLEANGNIDLEAVAAARADAQFKVDVIDVTAVVDNIETSMDNTAKYVDYDLEAAAEGAYDEESGDIAIAKNALVSQLASLNAVVASNVAAVKAVLDEDYAAYVADVQARADVMISLAAIVGYSADLQAFLDDLTAKYAADGEKTEIQNTMAKYDFYKDVAAKLDAHTANIPEGVDADLAATAIEAAKADVATVISDTASVLSATIKAQLTEAQVLLASTADFGSEVNLSSLSTFKALKKAIGAVDVELYDFTVAKAIIGEAEIAIYDELNKDGLLDEYNAFVAANGFNVYEKSEIAEIVRVPGESEVVRDKDYVASDEKIDEIIAILDKALGSTEVKGLGVDLSELIGQLPAMIYSDEIVNMLVGMLFPMITDLAIEMLSTQIPEKADIPSDVAVVGGKTATIKLPALLDIAKNAGLYLFPTQLAAPVREAGFEAAADALAAAKTVPSFTADKDKNGEYIKDEDDNYVNADLKNPWNDDVLYRTVVDEEGNEVKEFYLEWGIEGKDDFVNALASVLGFLEPVLASVLGNDYARVQRDLSTKNDTVVTIPNAMLFITAQLKIMHAVIKIGNPETGKGANLYNNVLNPIFEALGMEKSELVDGNTFKVSTDNKGRAVSSANYQTTKDMLYAILNPVESILDKVATSPVDFLTKALPNLAYALESGAAMNLINSIALTLDVKLGVDGNNNDATNVGSIIGCFADLEEVIGLDMFIEGFTSPMVLNIGELIDFDNLEIDGTKLDLSSLNGLFGLLSGLLGVKLPKIDGAKLATLGTLIEKDTMRDQKTYAWGEEGKAAYIEANQADVLIYVLNYVLDAVKDPEFIPAIVSMIGGEAEEGAEPFELPAIVNEILANVTANSDNAIAAITELVFPQKYTPADGTINWVTETTAPEVSYNTEMWTEEKAQFVVDNFPTIVDTILDAANVVIGAEYDEKTGAVIKEGTMTESLSELLETAVASLYTADTANALAGLLAGLVEGLDPMIADLLKSAVGLDTTVWTDFNAEFEGTDKEAFMAALAEILSPAEEVLKFLLAGENLQVKLSDENGKFKVLEIQGYEEVYANAIVPLVEALGATEVMAPEAFLADSDNVIANVIDVLVNVIDNLLANPYDGILDLVLNVVYFVASDGVPVVISNVLHPVNAVLEIISPIYKVNLNQLLGMDITFAEQDILSFLLNMVNDLIRDELGMEIFTNFNASSVLKALSFGEVNEFTSANGKTAYRVSLDGAAAANVLTVVGRFVAEQLVFSSNAAAYAELLSDALGLDDVTSRVLYSLFASLGMVEDGPDYVLGVLYYVVLGANTATGAVADYLKYANYDVNKLYAMLNASDLTFIQKAAGLFKEVYEVTFKEVIDDLDLPINSDDISGFAKLFQTIIQQIKDFFDAIGGFFKNIFG